MAVTEIDMNGKEIKELTEFMSEKKASGHPCSYLIAILHKAQNLFGYLDKKVMDYVAEYMSIPTAHIWGVATFYSYFNLEPKGKHVISVCMGTACYVKGADKVLDQLKESLEIGVGETTEDMNFTLREARCLGACGLAPVMMIDDKIYGELDPKETVKILHKYRESVKAKA